MTTVAAPLAGTVVALADVSDPVFSAQMVGAGVAIRPSTRTGRVDVVAPVAGRLLKLHHHAFVVLTDDKKGVLVHVGIDTVQMKGDGFELVATEGATVAAGDVVVRYSPDAVVAAGYDDVCPVVLMDSAADSVDASRVGRDVVPGDTVFEI